MTDTRDVGQTAYYQGAYDQCRRLLTSPRMNRPQREVIEAEALRVKAELESRGVKFAPPIEAQDPVPYAPGKRVPGGMEYEVE